MKRGIGSMQSVSSLAMPSDMSVNNAVRFIFAQLFFAVFGFMPTPI